MWLQLLLSTSCVYPLVASICAYCFLSGLIFYAALLPAFLFLCFTFQHSTRDWIGPVLSSPGKDLSINQVLQPGHLSEVNPAWIWEGDSCPRARRNDSRSRKQSCLRKGQGHGKQSEPWGQGSITLPTAQKKLNVCYHSCWSGESSVGSRRGGLQMNTANKPLWPLRCDCVSDTGENGAACQKTKLVLVWIKG